jgi:hypothetical protein
LSTAAGQWAASLFHQRSFASEHVIKYLNRYTHRVGIAKGRLVDVSERGDSSLGPSAKNPKRDRAA